MATETKSELVRRPLETAARQNLADYQREKDMRWMSNHVEDGGMLRCLANIREEEAREKEFQERTDHAALVNKRASDESAICCEINKIRSEKLRELYRRQQLRENDPEIKDLMVKLRAAYVGRDLKQQILHNEYRRLQEKREEEQANRLLQASLSSCADEEAALALKEAQRKAECCRQLQRQIVDSARRRQCHYEDTLLEKKLLDDVMRTIYEEDMRELEQKRAKTERLRRDQSMHAAAQRAWRDKHRQLVYLEERRLERQAAEVQGREQADIAERKRKLEIKEAINERVVAMILDEEAKKEERNDVILSLQEQEYLERSHNDALAEQDKLTRSKRENMLSLTAQMELRREQEAQEKERDRHFRIDVENRDRQLEEQEREKALKKKEKQLQYTRELKQQIQANELKRQKEKEMDDGRAKYVRDFNNELLSRVSTERSALISQHVPQVLGYLQPGVLQVGDLPAVRQGAACHPGLAGSELSALGRRGGGSRFAKCNAQCRVIREY